MRNNGAIFGYSLIGFKSLINGLERLDVSRTNIDAELDNVPLLFFFNRIALGGAGRANLNADEEAQHQRFI